MLQDQVLRFSFCQKARQREEKGTKMASDKYNEPKKVGLSQYSQHDREKLFPDKAGQIDWRDIHLYRRQLECVIRQVEETQQVCPRFLSVLHILQFGLGEYNDASIELAEHECAKHPEHCGIWLKYIAEIKKLKKKSQEWQGTLITEYAEIAGEEQEKAEEQQKRVTGTVGPPGVTVKRSLAPKTPPENSPSPAPSLRSVSFKEVVRELECRGQTAKNEKEDKGEKKKLQKVKRCARTRSVPASPSHSKSEPWAPKKRSRSPLVRPKTKLKAAKSEGDQSQGGRWYVQ